MFWILKAEERWRGGKEKEREGRRGKGKGVWKWDEVKGKIVQRKSRQYNLWKEGVEDYEMDKEKGGMGGREEGRKGEREKEE